MASVQDQLSPMEDQIPETKISIGVDESSSSSQIQPADTISISAQPQVVSLPSIKGTSIVASPDDINTVRSKLLDAGIEMGKILFFAYSDGTVGPALLYCKTTQGQDVLIEPPSNAKILGGDISLNIQRVGVMTTDVVQTFSSEFSKLQTGYAFISPGGIHLARKDSNSPVYYGFDDYKAAKKAFSLKKYHYLVLPLVSYQNLVEPQRLNTLEAYINGHEKRILSELVNKAGLTSLLTMRGPFTMFIPTNETLEKLSASDPKSLKATLLAHVVLDRIDPRSDSLSGVGDRANGMNGKKSSEILTDRNTIQTIGSKTITAKAIAQNTFDVTITGGSVVKLTVQGKPIKVKPDVVRRYNGVLYRIDGVLSPVTNEFQMPDRSDFDDVVTIFDISRATMEIKRIQFALNLTEQKSLIRTIEMLQETSTRLYQEVNDSIDKEGTKLLHNSNLLISLFYTREVPCETLCVETDQVAQVVKKQNEELDRLMKISAKFAALKVPMSKALLQLVKVEQHLHVPNPIEGAKNSELEYE